MLFYSNDGAIFNVLFLYFVCSFLMCCFLVRKWSVLVGFFVLFLRVLGFYSFRSSTLLDCIFLMDSKLLPLFSNFAPLCFQVDILHWAVTKWADVTVVLIWQVLSQCTSVTFWCIYHKSGLWHLINDCTLLLPTHHVILTLLF